MLFDTIYHTYKHLWTDISMASWRKYPSPDRPDVLSVDLLSKEIDPETGVLTCTKLIICKGSMPNWVKPILGNNECFFYEETTVDPKTQTMVLKTKNLSFANILGLEEVCTYTPDPNNAEWTQFKQEAKVTSNIFGVARKLEAFCLERFKTNATKGRAIMEQAIQKVKREAEEIEHSIDLAINTVVHEAEEQLHSIDKIITTAKLEAEESFAELEAKLDKALNNVKARDVSMEERITNFDKAFSSLRAELSSDRLGIPFSRTEFTKYSPSGINRSL